MKIFLTGLFSLFFVISMQSHAAGAGYVCTPPVKIKELWPRNGGWVHIVALGINDMDISNCGRHNETSMILHMGHANDTNATIEGKKMLYTTLLKAFMEGKTMELCSYGCDSVFTDTTTLSHIDGLK
jgi:hypothetical protein